MKSNVVWTITALVLVAAPAQAHFRLDQPADAVKQSGADDAQKPSSLKDGCPAGPASGRVTQVRAGEQLHVKITEMIGHGGHYRVSFGASEAAFKFPTTNVENNECLSTTIAEEPELPVLADGLFEHTQAEANAKNFCNGTATCETDVTIPDVAPGNYVLQVIEWMTPHASGPNNGIQGCFYAHCANLEVVDDGAPDSNAPDGPEGDPSSQTPAAADNGCGITASHNASFGVPLIGAMAAIGMLRRRRRHSAT